MTINKDLIVWGIELWSIDNCAMTKQQLEYYIKIIEIKPFDKKNQTKKIKGFQTTAKPTSTENFPIGYGDLAYNQKNQFYFAKKNEDFFHSENTLNVFRHKVLRQAFNYVCIGAVIPLAWIAGSKIQQKLNQRTGLTQPVVAIQVLSERAHRVETGVGFKTPHTTAASPCNAVSTENSSSPRVENLKTIAVGVGTNVNIWVAKKIVVKKCHDLQNYCTSLGAVKADLYAKSKMNHYLTQFPKKVCSYIQTETTLLRCMNRFLYHNHEAAYSHGLADALNIALGWKNWRVASNIPERQYSVAYKQLKNEALAQTRAAENMQEQGELYSTVHTYLRQEDLVNEMEKNHKKTKSEFTKAESWYKFIEIFREVNWYTPGVEMARSDLATQSEVLTEVKLVRDSTKEKIRCFYSYVYLSSEMQSAKAAVDILNFFLQESNNLPSEKRELIQPLLDHGYSQETLYNRLQKLRGNELARFEKLRNHEVIQKFQTASDKGIRSRNNLALQYPILAAYPCVDPALSFELQGPLR